MTYTTCPPHNIAPERRQYHTMRMAQVVDDAMEMRRQGEPVRTVADCLAADGVPFHVAHRVLVLGLYRKAGALA